MTELVMRRLTPLLDNQRALIILLCVLVGASIVFPPASLGVFGLLWLRRPEIVDGVSRGFSAERRWYLWIPGVLIVAFTVFKSGTSLPDDLNRHLTAYLHGYDYSDYYLYSDPRTPHASMWIGFEWLVGHLHQWTGLFWSTQLVQALAFLWSIWLFIRLFERLMSDHPERTLLTALGVGAVMYSGLLSRIQAGRPEVFLALLTMTALLCDTRGKRMFWWLAMLAAQPLYWLATVYAPAALLLPGLRWRTRIAIAASIVTVGLAFWLTYAGPEWYGFFGLLREWFANRAFKVSENNSIYQMLFVPGALILVLIAVMMTERRDWYANLPVLVVMAWFLAPDQVRYASVVAPLIAVLAARGLNAHPFRMNVAQRFIAVAALIGILIGRMYGPGYEWLPTFATMKGNERVLTMFDAATFYLPAKYPGVKVAPHLEAGATEREIQELLSNSIKTHKLDCSVLAKYPLFTHVVDRNIEEIPPCLELQETHREWRLWRVKPQ